MRHLWLNADYNGRTKAKDWAEQAMGWHAHTVKAVHRRKRYQMPNKPPT
jgi:hypothetical protein